MKNHNYNLIKLLHICLDNDWRISNYYIKDSANLDCKCSEILEKIKSDNQSHIQLLKEELEKHDLE